MMRCLWTSHLVLVGDTAQHLAGAVIQSPKPRCYAGIPCLKAGYIEAWCMKPWLPLFPRSRHVLAVSCKQLNSRKVHILKEGKVRALVGFVVVALCWCFDNLFCFTRDPPKKHASLTHCTHSSWQLVDFSEIIKSNCSLHPYSF